MNQGDTRVFWSLRSAGEDTTSPCGQQRDSRYGNIVADEGTTSPCGQQRDSRYDDRNIVELESHRELLQQIEILIGLLQDTACTRSAMSQHLQEATARFGPRFARFLVRALRYADALGRQDIVWLLTVLDDAEMVGPLKRLADNRRVPRGVRLAAALALAGMGETEEIQVVRRPRLYAVR